MKQFLYKVPNGKLLKVKIDIDDNKIKKIQILGDFFLYPEEAINKLEEELIGVKKDGVLDVIERVIKNEKITLLGFNIEDLNNLIKKGFD